LTRLCRSCTLKPPVDGNRAVKINSDIARIAVESRTVSSPAARPNAPASETAGYSGTREGLPPRWVADRRTDERRVSEALSIAQMAQHVLQRAVEISSRLRNMAIDAMAARRVDYREIAVVSAELSAAMGEYAAKFGSGTLPAVIAGMEDWKAGGEGLGLALREISSHAREAGEGRAVDLSRVDDLRRRIELGFSENERAVERLTRRGLEMARDYLPVGEVGDAGGIRMALTEAIGRDSRRALLAQGNIERDSAHLLLRT